MAEVGQLSMRTCQWVGIGLHIVTKVRGLDV